MLLIRTAVESLENKFENFLRSQRLLEPCSTAILAVSGGVDSMVMLRLFCTIQKKWSLRLNIAHVNHQLRGAESDGDEEFVRSAAQTLDVPFFCRRANTLEYAHENRLSKQEAARELRYQFFDELRRELQGTAVATAHQANDNAETVLLNVLRGAGVRGLSGIPLQRDYIIRPMLFASREEIEQYASLAGVAFRQDSSNNSLDYKRNLLRQSIIPMLKSEIQPDIIESLNRVSRIMRQLDESLQSQAQALTVSVVTADGRARMKVSIPALLAQPVYLQEALILDIFRQLDLELRAEKVAHTLQLCTFPTGRRLQLSRSIAVYHDRDQLVFVKSDQPVEYRQTVSLGATYNFESFRFSTSPEESPPWRFEPGRFVEVVDARRLGSQLVLRPWQKGDRFIPLGMRSKKKLSDFFTDEKIPLFEKSTIPILESDGEIVWVCGRRLDDRFKVTDKTQAVVRLSYLPTPAH